MALASSYRKHKVPLVRTALLEVLLKPWIAKGKGRLGEGLTQRSLGKPVIFQESPEGPLEEGEHVEQKLSSPGLFPLSQGEPWQW